MLNKRLAGLLLILLLIFSLPEALPAQAVSTNSAVQGAYLQSMINFINKEYHPGIPSTLLTEGALEGIFNNLDIYSTLYSPPEAEDFFAELDGAYSGVGMVLSKIGRFVTVHELLPASPAAQAGLLPGDRILSVDGTGLIGSELQKASSLLRGEEGTETKVLVFRPKKDIMTFKITREQVSLSPFTYEIEDDVAYIRMSSFTVNCGEFFDKILSDVDNHNIKNIILDLRDNPGGELSAAIEIAQRLVPRGLITSLDFKSPDKEDIRFYSTLEETKYQLAVLVNGQSASASEILSGAIQDTKAGVLIGSTTYGKSKVQSLIPLLTPEAYAYYKGLLQVEIVNAYELIDEYKINPADEEIIGWAKITTGEYFTPNGRSIDMIGLTPDYPVTDYEPVNAIDIRYIAKFAQTTKPGLGDESPDVESAEEILKLLGYEIDRPDSILDENTWEIIKQFQAAHSLYPYGVLDYITQRTLSNELDRSILEIDTQYAKAIEILNGY